VIRYSLSHSKGHHNHGVWGTEVSRWGSEAKPLPPEAEAKYEINVQFLTFSCRKCRI